MKSVQSASALPSPRRARCSTKLVNKQTTCTIFLTLPCSSSACSFSMGVRVDFHTEEDVVRMKIGNTVLTDMESTLIDTSILSLPPLGKICIWIYAANFQIHHFPIQPPLHPVHSRLQKGPKITIQPPNSLNLTSHLMTLPASHSTHIPIRPHHNKLDITLRQRSQPFLRAARHSHQII